MKAKDIMTKEVVTISEENTVEEVMKIILENKISGVPVVNEQNEVVGVVSESDLIYRDKEISTPVFVPVLEGYVFLESIKKYQEKLKKKAAFRVKDIMTTPVIKVDENEDVRNIANIMLDKKVNRVPVVNSENKLVGIVSRSDILKSF